MKTRQGPADGKILSILEFLSRKRRSGLKKVKKLCTNRQWGKKIPRWEEGHRVRPISPSRRLENRSAIRMPVSFRELTVEGTAKRWARK
jgi:hypothetical protein